MATRPASTRLGASSDKRAERMLGALSVGVLGLIALMTITVFVKAWPSFEHNGFFAWFGSGGDVDTQLRNILNSGRGDYHFRAWPLLWGTLITTLGAVVIGIVISTLSAIFIVEFAPHHVRRVIDPVVRLLAGVPSVVYGLIGILAIAPWVNRHLISVSRKRSVEFVVQLNGANLSTATLILTLMITPIMVAIIANALALVPRPWTEGSTALGVNRWQTIWRISVRTARPAIIAAAVLATARALGEAIMLAMVSGGRAFTANPIDGITFLFEPVRPLAATILQQSDAINQPAIGATIYAMAAVLLVSAVLLSMAGWAAKQPLKRYGIRA